MTRHNSLKELDHSRKKIAGEVRALRLARRWTQGDLAKHLGISQGWLSQIERGAGSFTAEEFLVILRLFNTELDRFATKKEKPDSVLQNALARFGASELYESADVLPSGSHQDLAVVIREVLTRGVSRYLTALAPIFVRNADRLSLKKIYVDLAEVGLERRLAWAVENTTEALHSESAVALPRSWRQLCRRAEVVLGAFLSHVRPPTGTETHPKVPDIVDGGILSTETLAALTSTSSSISKKWDIVSDLHPEDFSKALKPARGPH